MKAKICFYAPILLMALFGMSCSQYQLVSRRELSSEIKSLTTDRDKNERTPNNHSLQCSIIDPARCQPSSVQITPVENTQEHKTQQLDVSIGAFKAPRISSSQRSKSQIILKYAVYGMLSGAVIGGIIGLGYDQNASEYSDNSYGFYTLVGTVSGSVIGFVAGSGIGTIMAGDAVIVVNEDEAGQNQ